MAPLLTNSEYFVFLRESLAKVLTNQSVSLTKAQFHKRIFTRKKLGHLKYRFAIGWICPMTHESGVREVGKRAHKLTKKIF